MATTRRAPSRANGPSTGPWTSSPPTARPTPSTHHSTRRTSWRASPFSIPQARTSLDQDRDQYRAAQATVANLRHAPGFGPDHPRLCALIRTLTEHSAECTRFWNAHRARQDPGCQAPLPPGALTLTSQAFDGRDTPGQQLVIHHAEPDSPRARALGLLASLHATPHQA
ncbi:hypothetical protein [Streptomyces sp. KS_16]|uniref:MmyB family transcriptional regulator n=1 Tax=Streptomyces sp. KS_16 TaxID=1855350 RepID=UPI00352602CA